MTVTSKLGISQSKKEGSSERERELREDENEGDNVKSRKKACLAVRQSLLLLLVTCVAH